MEFTSGSGPQLNQEADLDSGALTAAAGEHGGWKWWEPFEFTQILEFGFRPSFIKISGEAAGPWPSD